MLGMSSDALQSAVLSKPDNEKKQTKTFSLSIEAYEALVVAARADNRTPSAHLEHWIRTTLMKDAASPSDQEKKP